MSYRETVLKHKQLIIIVAAIGAIASYMLPLDSLFAAQGASHNNNNNNANANTKARESLSSNTGQSSSTGANTNTNTGSSKKSGDTCFSNGICAQLGGPGDNGNVGRGNTGKNNIGINNNGNGNLGINNIGNGNLGINNIGNGNLGNNNNGNNNLGDFCGNGKGHHYGCLQHNPHVTG